MRITRWDRGSVPGACDERAGRERLDASICAALYSTEALNPALALAICFPAHIVVVEPPRAHVALKALHATASLPEPSLVDLAVIGLNPRVAIHFALEIRHSTTARATLVAAVNRFLETVQGDVVVTYLDEIIVRRIGSMAACVHRYTAMLPGDNGTWTIVSSIDEI
jgi:hypothetical protein